MAVSVTQSIRSRFPGANLGAGVLAGLMHPEYKHQRHTFPYPSVRDWLRSLEWPAPQQYVHLGEYPEDSSPGWTNNIQGVSHDDAHWFFTQDKRLWKIPRHHDLDADIDGDEFPSIGIPNSLSAKGGNHMGDCDFHAGFVYVPVEGMSPARIAMFNAATLEFAGSAPVDVQKGSLPWCAVNPKNGLLYSSQFNAGNLSVYKRSVIANSNGGVVGLELTHLYDFALFDKQGSSIFLHRIQGGTFSPRGHLYLVCDVDEGGILGFDMTTGRKVYQRTKSSLGVDVEMEGITIWDLEGAGAPHIGGQIHIVWLQDEGIVDDDIYFSHLRVAGADRNKI